MRRVRSITCLLAVALIASSTAASAEDAGPMRRGVAGLAKNGGFVLGIDNAFGYVVESGGGANINHFGLGPGTLNTHLSFHGVAGGGFTFGGILGLLVHRESAGVRANAVLLGPRLGYLLMSQRGVGVWPRVGVSAYINVNSPFPNVYSFSIDAPVIVSITEHAALTIGPTIERPLASGQRRVAGVTIGLMGAF
jgi:hypothetical protein